MTTGHSGIPFYLLAMPAFVRPLFGIRSDDNIRYLFNDHHVLRQTGFNFRQIEEGYSERTGNKGVRPVHPRTLSDFLCRPGYKETTGLPVRVVRKLSQPGLIRGHSFNTGTGIVFKDSPGYEFARKVSDYKGKHKNRRGHKVSVIRHVKSRIVVAVIITSANIPDKNSLLTTVRHAVTVPGEGVIRTPISDKGYRDGRTPARLKKRYRIDFIVPAKANSVAAERLRTEAGKKASDKITPGLRMRHFGKVTDAPNYDGMLQAMAVKDKKAGKKRGKERPVHVYLTSLSWNNALAVYRSCRERRIIENNAIKERCRYRGPEDSHCTGFNAGRAHMMISAVMSDLHILFRSEYGGRFTEKSVAAKKAPGFQPNCVTVYYDSHFGISDIREYTDILLSAQNLTGPP